MPKLRNIRTGVVVETADDVAGNMSRWEWEPADKQAPTAAAKKAAAKPPAKAKK